MNHQAAIRELIRRARARWRALSAFQAAARGAPAAAVVIGAALIVSRYVAHLPVALAMTAAVASILAAAALVWAALPLRHVPSDLRVARFVEERTPLDDRLVTAVDVMSASRELPPAFVEPMLADAAARAGDVDLTVVVSSDSLRRAAFQALAAAITLAVVAFVARGPARQAYDAAALTLFPEHVGLNVVPGDARVAAGTPLS